MEAVVLQASLNLTTLPLEGLLTHFKRKERQIVTLLHEGSLSKNDALTSSFPKVRLPQRRLQSKRHMPKEKKNGGVLSYLAHVDFYCNEAV